MLRGKLRHRHAFLLGLLACVKWLTSSQAAALVEAESVPLTPSFDFKAECPKLRIALINGVSFHFEVLAGLLHVLKPYEKHTDVYMSPWVRKENYDGAWDLVRWSKATFRKTNMDIRALNLRYHLAILVSTDYELKQNQQLLHQIQPHTTLAFVHNADSPDMVSLLNLTHNLQLLALSPHVATTLTKNSGRESDWMLAVYPVRPEPDCTASLSQEHLMGMCLRGFSMQGKFSNLRRNYSAVWNQITTHIDKINDPQISKVFHMNVLGKGPDRLNLPPELQQHVTVHRRLPYRGFYAIICHTLALVPSLANPRYYTDKFSSTIITSLSTGTPIIATDRLTQAYSFLTAGSVFPQNDGEEEVDTMIRISSLPAAQITAVRAALQQVRSDMNARAFQILEGHIRKACAEG